LEEQEYMIRMTIYFTADTHFHHNKIVEYSERPFKNVEEMDDTLIHNWNSIVKERDIVYHLGDFTFNDKEYKKLKQQLHGTIIHIKGNHDKSKQTRIKDLTLAIGNEIWQLVHNPIDGINNIVICGHVHKSFLTYRTQKGRLYVNVGVDMHNYKPISLHDLQEIIKNEKNKTIGKHHKDEILSLE